MGAPQVGSPAGPGATTDVPRSRGTESTAHEIAAVPARTRVTAVREADAQEQIARSLTEAGIECAREVCLGPRDRLDVLARTTAIEVKTARVQPASLWRQLQRYAAHDEVEHIVVASTLHMKLRDLPPEIGGVPVTSVMLHRIL